MFQRYLFISFNDRTLAAVFHLIGGISSIHKKYETRMRRLEIYQLKCST